MSLKPMLAATLETDEEFAALRFPLLVSPKVDGIRMTLQGGDCLSRSLKRIPSIVVRNTFGGKAGYGFDGLDGELCVGSITDPNLMQKTTSFVMSQMKEPEGALTYQLFDVIGPETTHWPYKRRLAYVADKLDRLRKVGITCAHVLPHKIVTNVEELLAYEAWALGEGYEGIMLNDPDGFYKNGRATLKQGQLIKLKRFTDAEATIIDTFEQEENLNVQTQNELGRSQRSSHQENKVGKNTLGGFICLAHSPKAIETFGTEKFRVGTGRGLTAELRLRLWLKRDGLPGQIIRFRYQAIGVKDKPRIPIYDGFRDARDM